MAAASSSVDSGQPAAVGRLRFTSPRTWGLWSKPARVVAYLLAVDATAVALVPLCLIMTPVQAVDLRYFAILLIYCVAYGEVSRRIERTYRKDSRRPRTDVNSVWMFAGVLLLHPALTAALIVVFYLHRWFRVVHRPVNNVTFTGAASICSAVAASGFLALIGHYHGFAELPRDVAGFAQVTAVAVVFLLVNTGLVFAVFALSGLSLRSSAVDWGDHGLEAATLALGALLAWALVDWPAVAMSIAVVTVVLHGKVLINQLRRAASTDPKTGLLNTAAWFDAARRELDRARRHAASAGVLIIDLDHFKRVNDEHGHLAGDEVLVAVAGVIDAQVRGYDLVGRFGGEEFVVLLPAAEGDQLVQVAERIRAAIARLTVMITSNQGSMMFGGLTASIGMASFPRHADTPDGLLRAADGALFAAKSAGRDRIAVID